MRPTLRLLADDTVDCILQEAVELLWDPGIRIHSRRALNLLAQHGARVDPGTTGARIPAGLVEQARESAPHGFQLYDLDGVAAVNYCGDEVHFDPGSAAIELLDYGTTTTRQPLTADFIRYVKLAESLPALDAASTALVCRDVPETIADLYRLFLVLLYSRKPIVTGAFGASTWHTMKELLVAVAGSAQALAEKPTAVFDCCPSPPLTWSEATCENLMDCAQWCIPAELVSMPLVGATAPATLLGAVVQHAAESLSGVVIHQLTHPGAPIVWGGSPAIFDMRTSVTSLSAIEALMISCGYIQVGKAVGLPTHTYMSLSDAKIVDGQCGWESGIGATLGALAGANMISGPGMLDFERGFSLEKLVLDAEIAGMAKRLVAGIVERESPLALDVIRATLPAGDFLTSDHTMRWFRQELSMPSKVVDREPRRTWEQMGALNAADRAHARAEALIRAYQPVALPPDTLRELNAIALSAARTAGMDRLPEH